MKRWKVLILSTVLMTVLSGIAACGGNNNANDTEAPYEDETNKDVNENPDNNSVNDDLQDSGGKLKNAGDNLMDSVKDAGDAIRDGVDDVTDTEQTPGGNNANGNNTDRKNTNRNTINNDRVINP